ncbi:MAG: hypothetical protein Q8N44_13580 [Rubrivivax sp.]|nr:hypothetical protein [Rubrivivax sp.]
MSDETPGFAAPPFDAEAALVVLRRQLRELRPLTERGMRYEIRGQSVIELGVADQAITARLAKRPARAPDWTQQRLQSSLDARRFVDQVKQLLPRWERDE